MSSSFAGLPKILRILDTAGTSQFSSLHDLYIKNGDGFLIVYNLANRQSFNDIRNMRETILRVKGLPSSGFVPLVLVGTKSDLFKESDDKSSILHDPINLANEWLCPHIETSARNNVGVEDVFLELLSQVSILCAYITKNGLRIWAVHLCIVLDHLGIFILLVVAEKNYHSP